MHAGNRIDPEALGQHTRRISGANVVFRNALKIQPTNYCHVILALNCCNLSISNKSFGILEATAAVIIILWIYFNQIRKNK